MTGDGRGGSSAVDLLVTVFSRLTVEEQTSAFERLADLRVTSTALAESETALYVRSLRRVADLGDQPLTTTSYRRERQRLREKGEELPDLSRVVRFFGSWASAVEAVALDRMTTVKKIEARFRARVGRGPVSFSQDELDASLARCMTDLERVPLVAEYEEWRLKEIALARLRGQLARIPSPSSFRRRHGSWPAALAASGFAREAIDGRLEPDTSRRARLAKVDRYSDATLRETLLRCALDLGRPPLIAEFMAWRAQQLALSGRCELVLPTDSPYRYRFKTWAKALAYFGFSEEEISARLAPGRRRSNLALELRQFRRRNGASNVR